MVPVPVAWIVMSRTDPRRSALTVYAAIRHTVRNRLCLPGGFRQHSAKTVTPGKEEILLKQTLTMV